MRRVLLVLTFAAAAAMSGCGSSDDGRIAAPVATEPGTAPAAAGDGAAGTADADATQATPAPTDSPAPSTPAAADVPAAGEPCRSSNLAASLSFGPGAGAAGSSTGRVVLRNSGRVSCTLRGFPGVSFVDDEGHQLGPAATRTADALTTVTLAPGAGAGAELRIANAGNYDAAQCDPVTATGLRVYPPGETAALFVRQDLKACAGDADLMTVKPVSSEN